MRIAVIYPPLTRGNKVPLLGQNRQFKYTHSREIKIFPLIPAHLATNLKQNGHDVLWLDAINKNLSMKQFNSRVREFNPEIIVMETKAPVVKAHWEVVYNLKSEIVNL